MHPKEFTEPELALATHAASIIQDVSYEKNAPNSWEETAVAFLSPGA